MFPKIYLCFVLCVTAVAIRAANILVFMPMPFKSHFRGFQPLFEELSHRGHNVTVASQFRQDGTIANYTDIGPFVSFPRGSSAFVTHVTTRLFLCPEPNRNDIECVATISDDKLNVCIHFSSELVKRFLLQEFD